MIAYIPDRIYRFKANATQSASMWHFSHDGNMTVCDVELMVIGRKVETETLHFDRGVQLAQLCTQCRGPIIALAPPTQHSLFEVTS